jgi:hypothetical protein
MSIWMLLLPHFRESRETRIFNRSTPAQHFSGLSGSSATIDVVIVQWRAA